MRAFTSLARLVFILLGGGMAFALTVAALAPRLGQIVTANEVETGDVNLNELALRSIAYDMNGDEFDVLYDVENRELVELADISPTMVESLIVVEDEGFYEHSGVDAKAIGRAFIENVNAGGIEQGGSTLTQQLIKNGVIGADRNLDRKIPEAALAIRLEQQLTKDEILEAYLNTVYFGAGAYGIAAASEIYFDTVPAELTWPQSALLASLISNPAGYDPTRFPEVAQERRDVALGRLLDTGRITETQHSIYLTEPLPTERNVGAEWIPTNYFIEEVRRQLLADPRLGDTEAQRADRLFGGGLRIYTTYDPNAQAAADAAVEANLPVDDRNFVAALAAIEPGTGYVRAIVGGPGFDEFEFNIATQKGRPTGSSFKPFVLATAFEAGYVPNDTINGKGTCSFDNPGGYPNPYRANNFSGPGSGSITSLRQQTLSSSNCAYVRLGVVVGLNNVAETANALGVSTDLSDVPISMPLGPKDVTPLDMANSYGTFANDGLAVDPILVLRVEDRNGNIIFENNPNPQRAISEQSARLVNQVLEANVRSGTGTRARLPQQPAAGKTGTAQDFSDAWFVGYTPHLATAVWMGNPDEQIPMRGVNRGALGYGNIFGGSLPARIWGEFNTAYHEGLEVIDFEDASGTRRGTRIRTDDEQSAYLAAVSRANSLCGSSAAEVDTDGDGDIDFCDLDLGSRHQFNEEVGRCPSLYTPIDSNNDGRTDGCAPPTTTTTTTTTTPPPTTAPPTTAPPTTAPPTTAPPTSSTTIP